MTAVSYSASIDQVDLGPDSANLTIGTSAPGAGDVELRISLTNAPNSTQIVKILDAFKRRLLDGRYTGVDIANV